MLKHLHFLTIVAFSQACACFASQHEVQDEHSSKLDLRAFPSIEIEGDKGLGDKVDIVSKAAESEDKEEIQEYSISKKSKRLRNKIGVVAKATTVAKKEKVPDDFIREALKHRKLLIKESPDLRNKEFYITKSGNLVFHNYL